MCQSFIICDSIDFLIFQKHFFPTHFFYFSLFSRFFFTILSLICAAIKYLKWVSDFFALFQEKIVRRRRVISHQFFAILPCHIGNSWVCGFVYWWRSNFFLLFPKFSSFRFSLARRKIFRFVLCRISFFLSCYHQNRITTNKHDTIHISRGLSLCHSFYQDSIIFPQFFL